MDEDGNVYVAATHRSDGQGVESRPIESADFAEANFQNPYLKQEGEARKEGKALSILNKAIDSHESYSKSVQAQRQKKLKQLQSAAIEALNANQDKLLAKAITQQMSGADFDQLAIVDAQYGARHAAILQNMGEMPRLSDMGYIQDGEYVSPEEVEQIKMTSLASNKILNAAKQQALLSEKENYEAPINSTIAPDVQKLLEGELNFDSEDEAKLFASMSHGQQIAYLRAKKGDTYLPSTSEASAIAPLANNKIAMYGGIALLAYLLLK